MVKDEALHEKREKAMLHAIDESVDGISRKEACTAMRCGSMQAGYHIRLMLDRCIIVRVRSGVRSRYCRPESADAVCDRLDEAEYSSLIKVRQTKVPADQVRVDVPRRPISSVFALAEAMA